MIARDLMTRDLVTVPEDMAVATVARVLAEAGISAVPVTDQAHRLLGIVAELDLLRRLAGEGEAPPGWLASLFLDERGMAERYTRTHGLKARDVMTRQVATVTEDATAEAIARLMEEKGIRSVPVVSRRWHAVRHRLAVRPAARRPGAAGAQPGGGGGCADPPRHHRRRCASSPGPPCTTSRWRSRTAWSCCRATTAPRKRSGPRTSSPSAWKACGRSTTRRGLRHHLTRPGSAARSEAHPGRLRAGAAMAVALRIAMAALPPYRPAVG